MNGKIALAAEKAVRFLKERGLRVSFAESCTGGMICAAVTSVSGASSVLDIGVVTYANWVKTEYTDVTEDVLAAHGAVSEQTALLMAAGIRKRSGADIGAGVTGIAGPDGGSAEKPVGTVYIAIDRGDNHTVRRFAFIGNREQVRIQAAEQALLMVCDSCLTEKERE